MSNQRRAARAEEVLSVYGEEPENLRASAIDLMTDIMHHLRSHHTRSAAGTVKLFETMARMAVFNFEAEA